MLIGLTYDLRQDYLDEGYGEEETAEFDRPDTIEAIENTLRELGHETDRIGRVSALVEQLARGDRWDLVYNIAEGFRGIGREAQVPALLDAYDIPYTYSDPLVCALSLHKGMTKRVIRDMGLPTPAFFVVHDVAEVAGVNLRYPLFAKPVAEGTSKGVTSKSKIANPVQLREVCTRLLEDFKQPVLVEEFLPGREFTVGVVGTGDDAEVVGVMEVILLSNAEQEVYTYTNKELCEERVKYVLASGEIAAEAATLALAVYRGLNCCDGGRVDLRADPHGKLSFIEVNPLPGIHPQHSDLPIMATLAGWTYRQLIERIVNSAAKRIKASARHGQPARDRRTLRLMRIVILHDQISDQSRKDEADAVMQARTVATALTELGHEWMTLGVTLDLDLARTALEKLQPDLVFNLVEALAGHGRLIHVVPALLDAMDVPYTGVSAEAQFTTSNKLIAKQWMRGAGIATPQWLTLDDLHRSLRIEPGQYILKSVWEHASLGLHEDSIIDVTGARDSASRLRVALEDRLDQLGGEGFAEQYVDGREFNLSLLGSPDAPLPQVLPPAEIIFEGYDEARPRVVGWRTKWEEQSFEYHHTPRRYDFQLQDQPLLDRLQELAMQCWRVFGLRGYARVDFRVDAVATPWVLEINTNPCLSPDAGFAAALDRAGIPFPKAIDRMLKQVKINPRIEV